jgi:hypothetical protein
VPAAGCEAPTRVGIIPLGLVGRAFARAGAYRPATGRVPERPKGAVCKTAGFAYTGSNPVPATLPLTCGNAAAVGWAMASERPRIPSDFPPPDAVPTPTARPVSLGGERGLARAVGCANSDVSRELCFRGAHGLVRWRFCAPC